MMTMKTMFAAGNDPELVQASLAGDREAFGQIVARYQSLVCSLAYSATGSLNASEDLAQETFLTAWRQLAGLREPEKLRSWLCAIARNIINNSLRRQGREPSHRAEALEDAPESHSPEPHPAEQTISNEEQAILWRSLEQIPELYREPMVLFYREHQSVESVAQSLELTEDAVKQRLARGRKMLHEQVAAFVEGALARSTPGKAFTVAVLASLPASLTISAKAATMGAAAKTGAAAKAAGLLGLLGPFISPVMGLWGMWAGYRIGQETGTDRERANNRKFAKQIGLCQVLFCLLFIPLMIFSDNLVKNNPALFVILMMAVTFSWAAAAAWLAVRAYRDRTRLAQSLTPQELAGRPVLPAWEYRSRFAPLGLPFIHIRWANRPSGPVKAWIAVGDCAAGVLFACGAAAVAPVSFGGWAVGLVSFGGFSLGVLSLGGLVAGVWSFGGIVFGWQAFGGCAIAWNAAWGGLAVAHDLAVGGMVSALQANTDLARGQILANPFFQVSNAVLPWLFCLNFFWLIPLIGQRKALKRLAQKQKGQPT